MALGNKFNNRVKDDTNTGFGANASDYGGRFINKDGRPNIEKIGINFFEKMSWYHTLLQISRWHFFLLVVIFYIIVNVAFASIYCLIGIENLVGLHSTSRLGEFGEAFFFSTQTFTTVGYGRISPTGLTASTVAALEALIGLLSFALATGLFYGRFSKPIAYIRFSEKMLLAPYKDGLAIMIRLAPFKNNNLTDVDAKLTCGIITEENGKKNNKFYQLDLELNTISALPLSWTIVHPINEQSPFYNFTKEDFENLQGETILYIKAFDDMFSNTVVARTSYTFNELIMGAKFIPMYHRSTDKGKTILDLGKLNVYTLEDVHFPNV